MPQCTHPDIQEMLTNLYDHIRREVTGKQEFVNTVNTMISRHVRVH